MRIFKHIKLGATALILFTCMSCEYISNLAETGNLVSKTQAVGEIKTIIANSPCRILLHNTESEQIQIEGYDNLIENLTIDYRNDSLIINHSKKNYLQKSKLINLEIPSINLNYIMACSAIELRTYDKILCDNFKIIICGSGKFTEVDLDVDCKKLMINIYGNNNIGNYFISGVNETSYFNLEGSVNIDALNLKSQHAHITHKSIGDCKVNTSTSLKVNSYSSGNTYFKGDSEVIHERITVPYLQSTGKVIKLN